MAVSAPVSPQSLDPRSEHPAFIFRIGLIVILLAEGILRTNRQFFVPSDVYLVGAGLYAIAQAIWWGFVAYGQKPGQSKSLITIGQILGILTDLLWIYTFANHVYGAHLLWLILLLPWLAVLSINRIIVVSVLVFDAFAGLAGLVVIVAGLTLHQVRYSPIAYLLYSGAFLLTWFLCRKRVELDLCEEGMTSQTQSKHDALSKLVNSLATGCLVVSQQGEALFYNQRAEDLLGTDLSGREALPEWLKQPPADHEWRTHRQGADAPVRRVLFQTSTIQWTSDEMATLIFLEDGDAGSIHGDTEARQDRLAAVGQLAAGLAHELGNPIAIIQSCATYLSDEYTEGALNEDLQVIQREATRCREMIDRMLALSSARQAKPKEGDLRESVHRAIDLVRYKADGVSLELSLPQEPVHYVYDDNQLVAILVNLLLNAISSTKSAEDPAVRLELYAKEKSIHINVSDNGCGIAPDQIERVFDPFFTKREGGTGLGLAMVHQVITALGGMIDVESQVGKGTCFSVVLPLSDFRAQLSS